MATLLGAIFFVGTRPTEQKPDFDMDIQSLPHANGKPVSLKGELTCLPHKDNSSVTTQECAFGLQTENGTYYSLRDADPQGSSLLGAPFHTPVTVQGTLQPAQDHRYTTAGLIMVSKISTE